MKTTLLITILSLFIISCNKEKKDIETLYTGSWEAKKEYTIITIPDNNGRYFVSTPLEKRISFTQDNRYSFLKSNNKWKLEGYYYIKGSNITFVDSLIINKENGNLGRDTVMSWTFNFTLNEDIFFITSKEYGTATYMHIY